MHDSSGAGRPGASDEALLAAIAGGDRGAFEAFYDRHKLRVHSLAARILPDRRDAEEVTMDVFTQVWSRSSRYDVLRGTVTGWLLVLTRSRSIDRLRSLRPKQRAERSGPDAALEPADPKPSPEAEALSGDRARAVTGLLGTLPAPQRVALEMAYFRGLSHSEIARSLGEPLGTVKTRIRQGLVRLRRSATGEGAPGEAGP